MSFSEFMYMDGHGIYVWSCYLVTTIIFVGLYLSVKLQHKKLLTQIRRRYKSEALRTKINPSAAGEQS